jgi:uncharacterized membrane protein YdbT with pleckstrin-like domain
MEENKYQKLGPRTLIYDTAAHSKIALILLILTLALVLAKMFFGSDNADSSSTGILSFLIFWGTLATIAAFILTAIISWLEYTMFQFNLGTDIFRIRRGVFTKEETAIPYRRIESVDIRRNLIHQLFGVSRINIETTIDSESTGDSKKDSSDEVFPVVDHFLAQTIQEELTKRANVQKMRV